MTLVLKTTELDNIEYQRKENTMHILDLPEIIFLHLFLYFEDSAVYFTLRRVCRRFRSCSDSYIKLEAKLLLFRDAFNPYYSLPSLTPKILYLFRKNQMIKPFLSKTNTPTDRWPLKTNIKDIIHKM